MPSPKIAILGDFNPIYSTHHALNESIKQCMDHLNIHIQCDWIGTDVFDTNIAFDKGLYSGLWIAPGSPYKDFQNVLDVIQYARTHDIPTLGNCGGFQHMIIEFARNVCGIKLADHEETNVNASDLVIHKLSCSLVGLEEHVTITDRNSILFNIIKQESFKARYFCSYGLNEKYKDVLASKGIAFTCQTEDGQMRSFEIKTHPFFLGTLFQPALVSTVENPNPIIVEFFRKMHRVRR